MPITYDKKALRIKGDEYCDINETSIVRQLGFGTQGMVFLTDRNTAIKVHSRDEGYVRERDVYRRLEERGIQEVQGLTVPRFMNWSDSLRTFEMSVVHVPCLLDFGGAYLDKCPEHSDHSEQWQKEKAEEFGENWERALSIVRELEFKAGIFLSDVNTGNIRFEI